MRKERGRGQNLRPGLCGLRLGGLEVATEDLVGEGGTPQVYGGRGGSVMGTIGVGGAAMVRVGLGKSCDGLWCQIWLGLEVCVWL